MTERRKLLIALALSVLLHLLFVAVVVIVSALLPKRPPIVQKPAKPLEIRVAAPTPTPPLILKPKPKPQAPPQREVMMSDGLQKTDKKDEKATFESDENLAAGSQLPAVGNIPLPSQQGKTRPYTQFQNRQYSPNEQISSAQPAKPLEASQSQRQQQQQREAQKQLARETPTATPALTPTPAPETTPPPDRMFALGKPTPLPVPQQQQQRQERQELAMLRPPQPPAQRAAPQETEKTEIEGSISNRGPAGVSAVETVQGRFQRAVNNAISSRWNYMVNQQLDLLTLGRVRLLLRIDKNGHVKDVRVLQNTSNETFASICVTSVMRANLPPIPDELTPQLQDGYFEITYNFYLNPQ